MRFTTRAQVDGVADRYDKLTNRNTGGPTCVWCRVLDAFLASIKIKACDSALMDVSFVMPTQVCR